MLRRPPRSTLFPLHDALPISKRSIALALAQFGIEAVRPDSRYAVLETTKGSSSSGRADGARSCFSSDRKSTRLNSSHSSISYAVFCLKKKKTKNHKSHILHTQ